MDRSEFLFFPYPYNAFTTISLFLEPHQSIWQNINRPLFDGNGHVLGGWVGSSQVN